MDARRRMLRHGLLLFVLGLVTGLAVPAMTNPRAGLAGHLEAVMNGMFLMIVGLAWSELKLSARTERWTPPLLLFGTYANWIATTAAALLGTSKATPIAGAGFRADDVVEYAMYGAFAVVAVAMLVVCSALALGLWRARA